MSGRPIDGGHGWRPRSDRALGTSTVTASFVVCALGLAAGCGKSPTSPDFIGTGDAAGAADGPLIDGPATDGRPTDGASLDGRPADGTVSQAGCPVEAPPLNGPVRDPGMPGIGAHGMSYCKYVSDLPQSLSSPAMETQASGSTIIVSIGRGDKTRFASPTDSAGNGEYPPLGEMHPYNHPNEVSGTAVYAFTSARGGADFRVVTATRPDATMDEITLAAIEVVGRTQIVATEWNVVDNAPLTSASVKTTGPATLVAFWWGSGFFQTPQSATPNNGFVLIDSNAYEADSFVQGAVAVKNVTAAGTYDVTWAATPAQGAQLWLVAVQ